MEPISRSIGFTAGFISGIAYRERHEQPYQDLKNTVQGTVLFLRRTFSGGPEAPGGDTEKNNSAHAGDSEESAA
jgi:hypothetical protein